MKLINRISVASFRGIRDLSVEQLSKVNIILGDNNCGKTSLMEALQLLRSAQGPANIYKIAKIRDSISSFNANSVYDSILFMFPKDTGELKISLSVEYDGHAISFSIFGEETKELLDVTELDKLARREYLEANGETEVDVFEGQSVYTLDEEITRDTFRLNRLSRVTGTKLNPKDIININYVSPFEHLKGSTINRIVKNDEYKEICLRALQLFDPEIEDMMIFRSDLANRPVEYLKHKRLGNMPLSAFGDGIKKVLVLANAIVGAANGILLIDEIETAIHKKYYDDIFRFIVKACNVFEVQVFITTHSAEAIDGLLATQDYDLQPSEDVITVVTLKRENNRTYSRVLTGREVYNNREAFGFEVRL